MSEDCELFYFLGSVLDHFEQTLVFCDRRRCVHSEVQMSTEAGELTEEVQTS